MFVDTYWYAEKESMYIDMAHDASRKAVELAPHLAESHAARGLAYRVAEQFDQAEAEFEKAIELNPRLFEPIHFYAQMSRSQGRHEKSAELFCRAGDVRPEDYQAYAIASNMYRTLEDYANERRTAKETVERAQRAVDVNPKDSRAWILGAGSLQVLDQIEEAFTWAEKAIETNPDSSGTAYNFACLLAMSGEHERAIDQLENAVRLGGRNKLYYETDVDFASLREHPRFQRLMDSI